jgi:hypothetical protein
MTARHEPIPGVPELTGTPAASTDWPEVVVEAEAAQGGRVTLRFAPAQALRVRTADVFVPPGDEAGFRPRVVVEVVDSLWLAELRADAAHVDHSSTFMDHARHFFLVAGDAAVDVLAWGLEWSAGAESGRHPEERPDPGWP